MVDFEKRKQAIDGLRSQLVELKETHRILSAKAALAGSVAAKQQAQTQGSMRSGGME